MDEAGDTSNTNEYIKEEGLNYCLKDEESSAAALESKRRRIARACDNCRKKSARKN